MSNPNFNPVYSTNLIFIDDDQTSCLTDKLNQMETDIEGIPVVDTTQFASANHNHNGTYSPVNHTHSEYAPTDHTHTEYALSDHNHSGVYASVSHTHAATDVTEDNTHKFMTSDEKTKLQGVAEGANNYVHPLYHSASMINETGDRKFMTPEERTKLSGIATGANNYTHPTTHSVSMIEETDDKKIMTAAERTKLAGIETGANNYTHPETHPASMITGLPEALPANGGNADTVDGKHATDFATASHTHVMSAITGLLDVLLTDSYGGVKNEYTSGDMLTIAKNWEKGMYTAYFKGGSVTNTPTDKESWRCIAHKTGALFGWLLAFGTSGSVYNNYLDNGTWRGWRNIYDANPAPLWGTSGYYMTAGHTVKPSKKLSECRNGWVLLWSDYDPDTSTSNEKDWVTTIIPKITPSGGKWSNKLFYCDIPRYVGDNTADIDTERRIIKQIYISDDKIVGHNTNNQDERSDVVLRAVYEF